MTKRERQKLLQIAKDCNSTGCQWAGDEIRAFLAQEERPGEPVKLVDLSRKPPRVALSDFPEYDGESSTTEGEREKVKDFLARFALELQNHNYGDSPHGPDLNYAAGILLALLAQPQEQGERIEGGGA